MRRGGKKSPGQHAKALGAKGRGAAQEATNSTETPMADAAFDAWLRKKLELLYGPVADEPLPEDLRNMIVSLKNSKKG